MSRQDVSAKNKANPPTNGSENTTANTMTIKPKGLSSPDGDENSLMKLLTASIPGSGKYS